MYCTFKGLSVKFATSTEDIQLGYFYNDMIYSLIQFCFQL